MNSSIQEINPRRIDKINLDNLVVEIGFGNGAYICHLAKLNPDKNFLGIEISGESVKKLSKRVKRESLKNVYSIKLDAYWTFYLFLENNSVYEIYINFPDPWPKKKHQDRRLTRLENLYLFSKKLKNNGFIQLKTDDLNFYNYTIENARVLDCFEIFEYRDFREEITTKYEEKWLMINKSIYTLRLMKISAPKIDIPIKTIRRLENMPSLKIKNFIDFEKLEGKIYKIDENLIVKFFKSFKREDEWIIETLLSENEYRHYFFTYLKKKEDGYILSISGFSEVLKTEGVLKFIKWLSNLE